MLGSALLLGSPALSEAPAKPLPGAKLEAQAQRVTPPKDPPFYRGSSISYRNVGSAIGINRAAEPTHNPFYAMQLALLPRVWFNPQIYARGSFDVTTELTRPDAINDRFVISDVGLAMGADSFYKVPVLEADLSTELSFALPSSKASQASTRVLAGAASAGLSRAFGDFSLSLSGNAEKYFNRHITGAPSGYLLGVCGASIGNSCISTVIQSGRRNASWALGSGLGASYKAKPWLSLSMNAGVGMAFLYDLPDSDQISLPTPQTTNIRYLFISGAGATVKKIDNLAVNFGLRSVYGQLAPDGSYRMPFINRFTQLYLDLGLDVAGLVSRFRS